MKELEKRYDSKAVEGPCYKAWENAGAFAADTKSDAAPFTIMMPPPNVTGSLHMGHALNHTLQDILTRYYRMKGADALWQPGMDHAGIATQMVVERQLAEKGITRHDLGREAFVERVWDWKEESGGTITTQLRRLGTSPDWEKERFTLDSGLSQAVTKVFVELHKAGLLYRDKRLVNWDCELLTAISDLEVVQKETKGHLWHFRYPLEDGSGHIVVATTRPETMFGDTAVAVHPEDARYQHLVGKKVRLPISDRLIPIVADEHSDPEMGSGAVKITPAHDFNDFEVGRRHDLPLVNVFDAKAHLNENVPEAYRGLDRYVAREKVIAEMESLDLLERIEDHVHALPHGDRSGAVIEPYLTDQWFVDAATLAKPAIEAVETRKTQFVPKHWENTYFEWMRNIQPWCISRQLWWGHRIPAWYGPDGEIFVAASEEDAAAAAKIHYGKETELTRDPDVLDTWFSSALWPFSTLGWPEETPELARYYPTDVLVTGFDIIFFWVARMMMMGLHFMGEVPFHTVYIHALVRDASGQKMSKSKGNIIDPLGLIEQYGCDALRFTLTALASPGRDIKLSEARVESSRNFATKLWNAARYCQMAECIPDPDFNPGAASLTVNRWIIGHVAKLAGDLEQALAAYRFNDVANVLHHFVRGTFCDWYLEFTKPILNGDDAAAKKETRATTAWALNQILHLLHPVMPFITEELWQKIGEGDGMLMTSGWPIFDAGLIDEDAMAEMDWVVRLITKIRIIRSKFQVPPKKAIKAGVENANETTLQRMKTHDAIIKTLANLESLSQEENMAGGTIPFVLDEATGHVFPGDDINVPVQQARLEEEIRSLDKEVAKIEKKLGNAQFLAKAPEEVVAEQRARRDRAKDECDENRKWLAGMQERR
ncbi:MAG: valine--tRNA ligase [Rhodospirillaceae bacterium]|nr:MAG: valine--tRNA ligase [Rhodospirillaceae bacterium]